MLSFENDCAELIESPKNNIYSCQWTIKCIIQDCSSIVGSLGSASFLSLRRAANNPAHMLTRLAMVSNVKEEWFDLPPN